MFRDIMIGCYRGLRDIELHNLEAVNVLVGDNNSGKTSVLEAIQLFAYRDVPNGITSIARKREARFGLVARNRLQPFDSFLYSFPMYQERHKEIYIEANSDVYGRCKAGARGEVYRDYYDDAELSMSEMNRYDSVCDEDGTICVIRGEYMFEQGRQGNIQEYVFRETQIKPENIDDHNNHVFGGNKKSSIMYLSPMDIYTDKVLTGSLYKGMLVEEKHRLLELMRLFDDRIIGIETAVLYGRATTMIEMESMGLAPISVFGDGIKKILTLASTVVKMRGGVVLIDEFETGIHKRALKYVAQWMFAVARRYDVQIFLTTHSSDAIAALTDAQNECDECISSYRLEHYKDKFFVKYFAGRDLRKLKNERGLDII